MILKAMNSNNIKCNSAKLCNSCVTLTNTIQSLTLNIYIYIYIYLYTQLHRYPTKTIQCNYCKIYILINFNHKFTELKKKINYYVYTGERKKRGNCVTFGQFRAQLALCPVTKPCFNVYLQNKNDNSSLYRVTQPITYWR